MLLVILVMLCMYFRSVGDDLLLLLWIRKFVLLNISGSMLIVSWLIMCVCILLLWFCVFRFSSVVILLISVCLV